MEIVQVKSVSKRYERDAQKIIAVNNINISVNKGEFVAIVGTSGSGKSTLLNIMGGLDMPSEGSVFIKGNSLYEMNEQERTVFRRKHIGFIFQSFNLISSLNVRENILLPLALDDKNVNENFFQELTDTLNIKDLLGSKINQLSGGQQQRVAIARALITQPDIVLADEPTGSLDSKNSMEVMKLFLKASDKYQQSVVMITHDEKMAQMAQRIIRIEDGEIYEQKSIV